MKIRRAKGTMPDSVRSFCVLTVALFGLGFFSNQSASAQGVLAAPPQNVQTPSALQSAQANEMDVFFEPGTETPAEPFRWGPLTLRPHPTYQFSYANGILVNPGQPASTTIQQVAPGFALDVGSHVTLDYTPTWTIYSNHNFQNAVNHAVELLWGGAYENWIFSGSQSYTASSSPSSETATQTSQETYQTVLGATYDFNSKMSTDLSLSQNFSFPEGFQADRTWSTLDWLNYAFWPRLKVAGGFGFGYDSPDGSSDMTFEQYQARIEWRATDKVSFQLHGGLQDQQVLDGGSGDLINPIFDGTIQYEPFDVTKLSLSVQRVVSTSFFTNQVTENLNFTGDLNQRLLKHFYLDLSGGYQSVKYTASNEGTDANRRDHYYFLNVRLNTTFLKRGSIAVFYQLSDDSSSDPGFSFVSHQFGFQIGYSY